MKGFWGIFFHLLSLVHYHSEYQISLLSLVAVVLGWLLFLLLNFLFRKRCSYKHRYPPLHVSDDYKIISSQEAIKQDMLSKPNFVQPEQRNDEVAISKRVSYGK